MTRHTAAAWLSAFIFDNSLLLAAGTIAGLTWANVDHSSYSRVSQALEFVVNDIGMVFFFALAVKEIIEAMLPGGALASPRQAAVPILAAAGGSAAPPGLIVLQSLAVTRPDSWLGWGFPGRQVSRF